MRTLLRWASGIMIFLGVGHLTLATMLTSDHIAGWLDRGAWAAVPLRSTGDAALGFWAGPGSFAVPLALLGFLTWHLAGRGIAVPAFVGWGLAGWCLIGGVLLVPSPYFAGVISGALIIRAHRPQWRRTP